MSHIFGSRGISIDPSSLHPSELWWTVFLLDTRSMQRVPLPSCQQKGRESFGWISDNPMFKYITDIYKSIHSNLRAGQPISTSHQGISGFRLSVAARVCWRCPTEVTMETEITIETAASRTYPPIVVPNLLFQMWRWTDSLDWTELTIEV
jgi:hypothetical protein